MRLRCATLGMAAATPRVPACSQACAGTPGLCAPAHCAAPDRAHALCAAGTRVPRTELSEMGPSLDLELRRSRQPPPDVEKEAQRRPKTDKKKVRGSVC